MSKIAVLTSGGIDSSVSLKLLKEQGHDLTAFYLKIWLEDELSYLGNCPWSEDLKFVQDICEKENIPLHIIPLQKEYWAEVVSYTLKEVQLGRTPNPDILCNQRIKFGAFLNKIDSSFDYIASGHYAQKLKLNDRFVLQMSPDQVKDQTYFLSHLSQEQLSKVMFPIGHLLKSEVRELGYTFNLPNKERKDSQGICFLGKLKFDEFLRHYLKDRPGDIIEFETGKTIGTHKGYWYYTIGQRQGIGLSGGPWYVVNKDIQSNTIYVSKNYYSEDKSRDELIISSGNWFIEPEEGKQYKIKLRHGPKFNSGMIKKLDQDKYQIKLDQRDQGIASGQFAVIYDDNLCVGGGIIDN